MIELGGVIAVTIRLPDGTEYRMERWTNTTPSIVHDPKFLKGDVKSIADYIQHWLTESAKKNKGQTLISSWGMYKNPYLAPSEYGILVIDYKTKTIVDCQGYVDITTVMDAEPEYRILKTARLIGPEVQKGVSPHVKIFEVKHPAWDVFKTKDWREAKMKIESLGFVLTKKEESIWQKRIKINDMP